MSFNPYCLINIFLAALAMALYIVGSYRFYKDKDKFILFLVIALIIDVATAILASLKITPTVQLPGVSTVPWYSLLFKVHVLLSMIGILGFIFLIIYLIIKNPQKYSEKIKVWQFKWLLPIWVVGETIALSNAISKVIFRVRLFELL